MVLKADQERVMTLLKDTITLLCRNGLNFKTQFCVDAVIGVTVDEDDLFYVSVKEIVKSERAKLLQDSEDKSDASTEDSGGEGMSAGNHEHRRKRRKKRVKKEGGESGGEDAGDYSAGQGDDNSQQPGAGSPAKKVCVKKEVEEDVPSDEDIVFIKQELDDNSWSHSQDMSQGNSYGDYSQNSSGMGGGMQPADQNFSSLSDMTLVPMDNSGMGSNNSGMWSPQQQRRPYMPRGPRSTTVTSTGSNQQLSQQQPGGPGPMGMGDPNQQQGGQQQISPYTCHKCNKLFRSVANLKQHLKRHEGKFSHYCTVCNKGFMSPCMLRGHMAVHTGIKEFSCNLCGKLFAYKIQLNQHLRERKCQMKV